MAIGLQIIIVPNIINHSVFHELAITTKSAVAITIYRFAILLLERKPIVIGSVSSMLCSPNVQGKGRGAA